MSDTPATPGTTSDTLAQAVYQVFKDRPNVITAALKQFSAALNNRFPGQQINVLTASLNAPNWVSGKRTMLEKDGENTRYVERQDTWIEGYNRTPLLEVMVHGITGKAQLYFSSDHFLGNQQNKRLRVDMREIEDLLRRLPQVMIPALQQALTDFWNEPAVEGTSRGQWLSETLRTALLVSMGPSGSASFLDQDQADTLLQVILCPDKATRSRRYGTDCAQTFLIDYQARTGRTFIAHLAYDVLVTRKINGREVVVWFEPDGAVKAHDSLQAFADAETEKWGRRLEFSAFELQPYESIGDAFVTQAQALLNNQLENLNSFGAVEGQDLPVLEERYARLTDLAPYFLKSSPGVYEQTLYNEVSYQLPDWVTNASDADALDYSRYMFRLAALQLTTQGLAYNHGIGTAQEFARKTLQDAMPTYGEVVDPDQIEVTQYRNEDGVLLIVGSGTGRFTSETQSLTHRALNNLAGLPFLASEFKHKDGTPAPTWMTLDNLRKLISDVDIGKHYPAEIKRLLLDDPLHKAEREKLFADQLRIQLPMLALEYKIRGQSGFSDVGYRCVAAIMQPETPARRVSGQPIVLRHLAFKTDVSNQTHVVPDMFLFGPADASAGPHILYRPLYPEQLIEFASLDALLEEIASDNPRPAMADDADSRTNPSLHASILDWMAPDVRHIYDNGGFREPHLPGVIFEVDVLRPSPAELDRQALEGDVLTLLYEANAQVLTHLAEEQTLSNTEYRWNTLKAMGLLIFDSVLNVALPFLRGPAAAVGWLFVTQTAVLQALQPLAEGDSEPAKDLTFNLLINLALALLIQRLSPGSGAPIMPVESNSIGPGPGAGEIKALLKPPVGPGAANAITDSVLDFSSPVSADSRQLLERFLQVDRQGSGPVIDTPAPKGIEVVEGRWYAKVPGRLSGHGWANVAPTEGENVVILDNRGAPIKWLELRNTGEDLWDIAAQFRVRGGGPGMSRYLSDVFADPQLRARRADHGLRVKQFRDRAADLHASIEQAEIETQSAFDKARAIAEELKNWTGPRAQLENLRKNLRNADLDYKKKARLYIDGYLNSVGLLEEIAALLEKDKDYQRDAIIDNLRGIVSAYGVIDEELQRLSAIWPEAGFSHQNLFPLAFELMTADTDFPYSALLEVRKRTISSFPERISVSSRLEQEMVKLETLDRQARKGYLQRVGELSIETQELIDIFAKRDKTTQWLITQQLITLRGVLAGDPALEPSLLEVAGLEGLSKAKLGEVTDNVLRLNSTQGFDLTQRVQLLHEAVGVYNDAELMANNLRKVDDRQSYVPQLFLQKFLESLKHVRDIAQKELSESITEDVQDPPELPEPELPVWEALKKSRKRTKRPTERLINTAEGYRVGDAHEKTAAEPDETVLVKDTATGNEILYYRHEGDDVYRQRHVERPKVPQIPKPAPALQTMLGKGKKLLEGANAFIARYRKDAPRYREPVSLEDMFVTQAKKLTELAGQIQQTMKDATGTDRASAVKTYQDLRNTSEQLTREGKQLRIKTTKALPPNAGSFEYLLKEHEIKIENPKWVDKSTYHESDFLLEYAIVDNKSSSGRVVLWYAHFHCTAKSVSSMIKAHLKLERLRFLTVKDQLKQSGGKTEGIVYPADMQTSFSRVHFFDPIPPRA